MHAKHKMKSMVSAMVLLAVCNPVVRAAPALDADDRSTIATPPGKSYVYKTSAGKPQSLEIYFPAHQDKAKPVPGVILFHGGGWGGGDLKQFRHACEYLASRGLVAATVDYRMLKRGETSPDGLSKKEVCVVDAKSAIRWMKQHAAELGVDPKRIITGGGSAGGHLSVLATTHPELNDPQDPPGIDTSVVAYLLFNPALAVAANDPPSVDALRYVPANLPPAILFFGTQDDTWKPAADAWYAKVRQLGSAGSEMWVAEDEKHGFFNRNPWTDLTLAEADRFLVQHGLLAGKSTLETSASGKKLTRVE